MSDQPQISYSFQMQTDTAPEVTVPAGKEGTLLAADRYDSCPVDGGVLLVGQTTGGQMLVQPEVETVLQHCTVFRTLREHAEHLVAVIPQLGGNVADVISVLEQVHSSGLFITADSICAQINRADNEATAQDRCVGFVITCDRPQAVARLLESMMAGARLSRLKRLYLVDDSRDPANREQNREALAQFNLGSPVAMTYFGSEEQATFLDSLKARLPGDASAAVDFLFDREHWSPLPTYGRSRSLCLLLSVGERCIVMDDDVLCEVRQTPGATEDLNFSDGFSEAAFFARSREWEQLYPRADFDPLAGHARCLGRDLAEVLREYGVDQLSPAMLRGVSAWMFHPLSASSPVLVTQSGTLGDPGTPDNAWLGNMTNDSLRRALAVPNGLGLALATRETWLGQTRPTVSKRAVMSQVTGLDNRRHLPPYFPALRGEDLLFGALLDFLYPDSVALEYNWSVPHLPLEERRGNLAGDSVVPKIGLQLVASYLSDVRPEEASVSYATRVSLAAARLHQLAEMSDSMLLARLRRSVSRAQAFTLQTQGDRLRETGSWDEDWQQYLSKNVAACGQALQRPVTFADLPGAGDEDSGERVARHIRQAAAGYADALMAWGSIRSAAAGLVNDS